MERIESNEEHGTLIHAELSEAQITIVTDKALPDYLSGRLGVWTFERLRRCWVASAEEGQGLPESVAEELNKRFRNVIRIEGFVGGTEVHAMLRRGRIHCYHIDTQEGLNAFGMLIAVLALRRATGGV